MSVITASKSYDDLHRALSSRGDLLVMVQGSDKCANTSKTGGTPEVRELRERLRESSFTLRQTAALVDAVEEGLCDPKAVAECPAPLASAERDFLLLVLSCGVGLNCALDALPGVRIVSGLDTVGPGVKGELACLACRHREFAEGVCKSYAWPRSRLNDYRSPTHGMQGASRRFRIYRQDDGRQMFHHHSV